MEVEIYWNYEPTGPNVLTFQELWADGKCDSFPEDGGFGEPWEKLEEQILGWKEIAIGAWKLLATREAGKFGSVLDQLELVEISLISDEQIGIVHDQYLQDGSPTDIITFHHGELLISLDTTIRQAKTYQVSDWREELSRYIVHGFCHLHGYNDLVEADRNELLALQESILVCLMPEIDKIQARQIK